MNMNTDTEWKPPVLWELTAVITVTVQQYYYLSHFVTTGDICMKGYRFVVWSKYHSVPFILQVFDSNAITLIVACPASGQAME